MSPRLLKSVLAAGGLGLAGPALAREPAAHQESTAAPPGQAGPRAAEPASTSSGHAGARTPPATSSQGGAPAARTPPTAGAEPPKAPSAVRYRVSTDEAPRHVIAGGKGRATLLLNPSTGATAASVTLLELQPGGEVPEHTHDTSAEILYIQDGAADMVVSGQSLRVGQGDAVYIPAGAKHSARVVTPGATFKAVQVYAGPGPEQRFTQGPRENTPHGR
ncbi:cupin domain-containing protein [Myxococcus stipitatus]|uniref:cupin domain-containing protein n=1 Tax=Myxococcus stipitatus TaxID=83455 RepID=UPI001F18D5B0|nr:cupin domain-containing protein [Myxococcus stipitatus]MCE9671596.1 cupin domain-containing protein [Myxococcus stipitatus]